jgi:uncharacterized membrane protein YdbT with pleckstrin-like domain
MFGRYALIHHAFYTTMNFVAPCILYHHEFCTTVHFVPTAMYQHCCLNVHHLTFSLVLCRLWCVVFVMYIAAHNSTMWTYFYFLFLCHMSTSGFEVICTVTSCLKGHLSYS